MSGPSRAILNLSGRVAVILGAHGTLGAELVRRFESVGAVAVGADLREAPGILGCDVTDESSVSNLFDAAEAYGEITDVVHAVGIASVSRVKELDVSEVRKLLEINLLSCFITAKIVASRLPAGGTVTFIASHAACHGSPGWSAYGASKAGLINLVESFAKEIGSNEIRVNAVSPGSVESPMMEAILKTAAIQQGRQLDAVVREAELASPLGRFALAREVADVCLFLASPLAAYVTGTNIVVNGGERPG
jgi:3-oxoacyl-[acyl-carrier protein] reductase